MSAAGESQQMTEQSLHGLSAMPLCSASYAVADGIVGRKVEVPANDPPRPLHRARQPKRPDGRGRASTAGHIAATSLTLLGRQKESFQVMSPNKSPQILTR